MSDRRSSSLALLAALAGGGCRSSSEPLGRVAQARAADAVEVAEAPVAASVVLASLSDELCRSAELLLEAQPGDVPQLSPELLSVLGTPEVIDVLGEQGQLATITLGGVDLLDREDVELTSAVSLASGVFSVSLAARDDDASPFGRANLTDAGSSCVWTSGRLSWTTLDEISHDVLLPDEPELGFGISFRGSQTWLPVAGTLSWSAFVDSAAASYRSFDAGEICQEDTVERCQGLDLPAWPGIIRGTDWSTETALSLDPGGSGAR